MQQSVSPQRSVSIIERHSVALINEPPSDTLCLMDAGLDSLVCTELAVEARCGALGVSKTRVERYSFRLDREKCSHYQIHQIVLGSCVRLLARSAPDLGPLPHKPSDHP